MSLEARIREIARDEVSKASTQAPDGAAVERAGLELEGVRRELAEARKEVADTRKQVHALEALLSQVVKAAKSPGTASVGVESEAPQQAVEQAAPGAKPAGRRGRARGTSS